MDEEAALYSSNDSSVGRTGYVFAAFNPDAEASDEDADEGACDPTTDDDDEVVVTPVRGGSGARPSPLPRHGTALLAVPPTTPVSVMDLSDLSSRRDWNSSYQSILEMPESVEKCVVSGKRRRWCWRSLTCACAGYAATPAHLRCQHLCLTHPRQFEALRDLARDFEYAAQLYARLIVSEVCLSPEQKSIKPVKTSAGVNAGGMKFVCAGSILFKFALDTELEPGLFMYGGSKRNDSLAIKSGNHELKGLIAYMGTETSGLHYPLMVTVDYKGYRLVAVRALRVWSAGEYAPTLTHPPSPPFCPSAPAHCATAPATAAAPLSCQTKSWRV